MHSDANSKPTNPTLDGPVFPLIHHIIQVMKPTILLHPAGTSVDSVSRTMFILDFGIMRRKAYLPDPTEKAVSDLQEHTRCIPMSVFQDKYSRGDDPRGDDPRVFGRLVNLGSNHDGILRHWTLLVLSIVREICRLTSFPPIARAKCISRSSR